MSYGFLAPPTVFVVLSLAGVLIALVWRRIGMTLALVSGLCLYAAATPALSSYLLQRAERGLQKDVDFTGAQAIVVLGGDVRAGNGADIPDRLGGLTLERVRLGADAYHRLRLP